MNNRPYELNEYQLAAVRDEHQTCLVNANVGSGKTTVLIEKIKYFHETKQIAYDEFVILTFTNRAAGEIRERIAEDAQNFAFLGTFHSVAWKLLKEKLPVEELGFTKEFELLLPEKELELAKELIEREKLKIKYANRLMKRLSVERKKARYQDDLMKLQELLGVEKKKQNCMSYDDLIFYCTLLLQTNPYHPKMIVVDEIQDSDAGQLLFLEALKGEETYLFAVGDPNQVIYSFRGSDSMVLYSFKTRFGAYELSLPINYRSDATILEAASRFKQGGAKLSGVRSGDSKVVVKKHYDPFAEALYLVERINELHATGIEYGDIAIFYRMQNQANVLVSVFEKEGVPFWLNTPKDKDTSNEAESEPTQEEIVKQAFSEREKEPERGFLVHLMTLHASKGLEFSHVFIIGVNNGLLPLKTTSFDEDEEERRLFYVGMTRAKNYLELSYYVKPADPRAFGGPGRFLQMLPAGCLESEALGEKTEHLQNLRKEVASMIKQKEEASKEKVRQLRHAKYGIGTVVSEDDMMITLSFENYGEKEFVKAFTVLEEVQS